MHAADSCESRERRSVRLHTGNVQPTERWNSPDLKKASGYSPSPLVCYFPEWSVPKYLYKVELCEVSKQQSVELIGHYFTRVFCKRVYSGGPQNCSLHWVTSKRPVIVRSNRIISLTTNPKLHFRKDSQFWIWQQWKQLLCFIHVGKIVKQNQNNINWKIGESFVHAKLVSSLYNFFTSWTGYVLLVHIYLCIFGSAFLNLHSIEKKLKFISHTHLVYLYK